jgi:uroporphyrinogen decarboxylase
VRDEVKRNIEILAPGGGFVFNTIHNIQADVPPENIAAMFDVVLEFGRQP